MEEYTDNTHGGAARKFAEWSKGPKAAKRMRFRITTIAFITVVQGGGKST